MRERAAAAPSELDALLAPPSAWARVLAVLARRRLARASLACLVLLHTVAVFAPLLASDRPLVLVARDTAHVRALLGRAVAIAASAERVLAADAPGAAALAAETGAAAPLARELEDRLAAGERADLARWSEALRGATEASGRGELERARSLAAEATALARALRERASAGGGDGADGADASAPAQRTSFPLLASLTGLDVALMLAWIALLAGPLRALLLARPPRHAHASRRARATLVAALAASALAGVAWGLARGEASPRWEPARAKRAIADGEIQPVAPPRFTLLAYGFGETHMQEAYAPPSWTGAGRERARAAAASGVAERPGEPALGSPWRFLAGTDELGRDFLTRMIWGARASLSIGLVSALLSTAIGILLGALAGYAGGAVDAIVLRTIEVLQSIPAMFLVLFAMAFTDPRVVPPLVSIIALIALVRWTGAARLVRGEVLRLREREFVLAARALGLSSARTVVRHVLPNASGAILVHAAFAVSAGILAESAISFLGLGVRPPEASWGALVGRARDPALWWIQLFPGILIFLTVTCTNLVGDAVRDALDPRVEP